MDAGRGEAARPLPYPRPGIRGAQVRERADGGDPVARDGDGAPGHEGAVARVEQRRGVQRQHVRDPLSSPG
ncbi:hypothetical protein STTU_2645 [Streptomyces sp. Tu6071]|nr:hypothetical protein STTU_2645 [Streptomyces sp. Tu6071]